MQILSYICFVKIVVCVLSICFLASCASLKNELKQELKNIDLIQGEQIWKLSAGHHTIQIRNKEFAMVFLQKAYNKKKEVFHTVQVNTTQNIDIFNSVAVGKNMVEIECFSPGSGLAMRDGNNPELMLVDYGHHYLYYENEDDRRLTKLGTKGDYYYLEWRLDPLQHNPDATKNDDGDIVIYVSIIIDRNKNKQIDDGELWKIQLTSMD